STEATPKVTQPQTHSVPFRLKKIQHSLSVPGGSTRLSGGGCIEELTPLGLKTSKTAARRGPVATCADRILCQPSSEGSHDPLAFDDRNRTPGEGAPPATGGVPLAAKTGRVRGPPVVNLEFGPDLHDTRAAQGARLCPFRRRSPRHGPAKRRKDR